MTENRTKKKVKPIIVSKGPVVSDESNSIKVIKRVAMCFVSPPEPICLSFDLSLVSRSQSSLNAEREIASLAAISSVPDWN